MVIVVNKENMGAKRTDYAKGGKPSTHRMSSKAKERAAAFRKREAARRDRAFDEGRNADSHKEQNRLCKHFVSTYYNGIEETSCKKEMDMCFCGSGCPYASNMPGKIH